MTSATAIRTCTAADWPDYAQTLGWAFGQPMSDDGRPIWERVIDFDKMIVATEPEAGRTAIVGTAGWLPFEMAVPGGELPVAGVTMVSVRPTHRRRGILRQMMRHQLDDLLAKGIAVATLWASEPAIYQRFGYGLAFRKARIEIDARRAAFLGSPAPVGRARLLSEKEAWELLPGVYERARQGIPGSFRRTPRWWTYRLSDPPSHREGGSPMFRMVLDIDGILEGYALYRVFSRWGPSALPNHEVDVIEAIGAGPVATREVWRFLFSLDLVGRVRTHRLHVAHPLFLALSDPRQLQMIVGDGTWLRLIDVGAALAARRYGAEGALTFELEDAFCPWNAGVWTLEASADAVDVRRANAAPAMRLTAAELGAMYLGTVACSDLVRAGRVDELEAGAAARADALFRSDVPPWCLDDF